MLQSIPECASKATAALYIRQKASSAVAAIYFHYGQMCCMFGSKLWVAWDGMLPYHTAVIPPEVHIDRVSRAQWEGLDWSRTLRVRAETEMEQKGSERRGLARTSGA
eukprot:6486829-Amphidinium_carterae.1